MQGKVDRAHLKVSHWGDNIRNFKDRALGGIAGLVNKVKNGAGAAWGTAKAVGHGVKRAGESVYHVGRDIAHFGRDVGHGMAATYRGARDLYRAGKKGANAAMSAYNYMTGDAPAEEKVKAAAHVAGEGAKMLGRGAAAAGNVGWKAAKGVYNAYMPEEKKKQISGVYNAVANPISRLSRWFSGKKGDK
jgi:hypothetical protein